MVSLVQYTEDEQAVQGEFDSMNFSLETASETAATPDQTCLDNNSENDK